MAGTPRAVPVQTYGQRKVEPAPLELPRNTLQPNPDQFGAGFGAETANVLQGIFAQELQNANEVALLDARNQLSKGANDLLYNPDSGVLNMKGKDAIGATDTFGQKYGELVDNISSGLTRPQQAAFQRQALSMGTEYTSQVQRHVFDEQQAYDTQETVAGIENAQNAAALAPDDPRNIRNNLDVMQAMIRDHARRQGAGPEETQFALDKYTTQFHAGIVDALLANDQDQKAQIYFDGVKDQMNAATRVEVEKKLEVGSLAGESQRRSDAILATGDDLAGMMKQVQAIDDPKLRDATQTRVVEGYNLQRHAQDDAHHQLMIGLLNKIDQGGLKAIDRGTWSGLDEADRNGLEAYAKRNAVGDGEGKTDIPTFYKLMQQAGSDPEGFAHANLLTYASRLSRSDFERLAEYQRSILDKKPVDAQLAGFRTADQVINDTLRTAGIGLTEKPDDKAKVATFYGMVDDKVKALEQTTGKKATPDDIQKIASDLISRSVAVPATGGIYNDIHNLFFAPTQVPKRLLDLTIDDVPTADKQQITQALQRQGRIVTDDTILQVYRASKAGGAR